jgi:tetratricopeptide (TPR) repeat protein
MLIDQLQAELRGAGPLSALSLAETLPFAAEDQPVALAMLGEAIQRFGRMDAAIACFRRRAMLVPLDVGAWVVLGDCLLMANRISAAEIAYNAALRLSPLGALALCAKARLLVRQGDLNAAETAFRQALNTEPGCKDALLSLANLAVKARDWAKARDWTDALERAGGGREASWLRVRIDVGRGDFAAAEAGALAALAAPDLTPLQRAEILLLRGEALDGLGRTKEAFKTAVDGKRLQHEVFAERAAGREAEPAKLARLAAWFATCDPRPWRTTQTKPRANEGAPKHVFLIGFPRAGTTLLEQALAGHPDVAALEEAPMLAAAFAEFLSAPEGLERLSRISTDEAAFWRERYWQDVKAFGGAVSKPVFIDKNPAATCDLPLISKLFPDAKVLFARRDPRDVVLSCLRNNFQMNAMTYAFTTLEDAAACYDACMRMTDAYLAVLPVEPLCVQHEALIADFPTGLDEICRFIGIDLLPEMLDVAATTRRRVVRTPSASQLREGVNLKGVDRWRHYAEELAPVLPLLDPWAHRFGYQQSSL